MEESPRKKKGPRKVTARSLENAALYYLRRFSSSTSNFRQVMMRRIYRAAEFHGSDMAEGAEFLENIIRKFTEIGYLNDAAYAQAQATTFHRRGGSARAIRVKLMQKGLDGDAIDHAFQSLGKDSKDPELTAALTMARKKRLGPYRPQDKRQELREKDLAAMARTGFTYDMALKVIDAETVQELEELVIS